MAVEKKWLSVVAVPLTADGSPFGVVTVADTTGFKVKGFAFLKGSTTPPLQVQVQRVLSSTQMIVGPIGSTPAPNNYTDVTAYTVADAAMIAFPEQDKNKIKPDDIDQAVYEADPTVAIRTVFVDQYGNFYNATNPLPIVFDGTVEIGEVEVIGRNGNTIEPNPNGSVNVVLLPSTSGTNTVKNTFGTASSVPSGATTTIVTYVVPIGKTAILEKAVASGTNIGTFTILINSVTQGILRTYFFGPFNVTFDFVTGQDNGLVLQPGDVVTVNILHMRPFTGDFDARIQVFEVAS
jgi:hypothetical protein